MYGDGVCVVRCVVGCLCGYFVLVIVGYLVF